MAQELDLFSNNMSLPAHLQGVDTGVTKALVAGMFTGGNRIGLKASRFRLIVNGIEEGVIEENYLDLIFLSAAPAVSRVFYSGAYKPGENTPPTCYSADGIVPNDDVKQKQNDKCATCPQNVKGSKIDNGNKYKACGYFRRGVVMLAGDVDDRRVFKLDIKSQSLFGESTATAKSFNDYVKVLETRGVDAGQVVTRVTFDIEASVPKLLFKPQRYIDPDELEAVKELVVSDEVRRVAEVNMGTLDVSGEEPTGGDEPQQQQQEVPAQQTQRLAQTQQATQRPAPQQTQRPAPQTTQRPAQQARPVQRQQQAEPVIENIPQQAQQAQQAQQTQQVQQNVPVQEVGSAADLEKLLDELDL